MKKILLVSIIGLVLFGCDKKQVTEDMLIGDWKCMYKMDTWKNGVHSDKIDTWVYNRFIDDSIRQADNINMKFFKKNGQLYRNIGGESKAFNLAIYYDQPEETESYTIAHTKTIRAIDYLSDDKFKINLIREIHSDIEEDYTKFQMAMTCDRKKE
ncbi:hypothetical protein A9G13_01785 [Gilliamella sp. wkB178]|uniref:hypothetical protein n=1 Tax=Gilliamella sp. wkB178 TaxID=3120259 RepID=UPI00080EB5CC|nr:hypothetical protein [Gilliamella apicola]OCG08817.1 hypothetical protein A9G13_01785 [Gilliamella apicola]